MDDEEMEYRDAVVDDLLYLMEILENANLYTKAGDEIKLDLLNYIDKCF